MQKLVIYGAAHAFALQTILAVNRTEPTWELLGFLDDTPDLQGQTRWGLPVLGGRERLADLGSDPEVAFYNNVRSHWSRMQQVTELLDEHGCRHVSVVHPSVDLTLVEIGQGCHISPNCVISAGSHIGDFVSILANCVLGHDVAVEPYAFIAQTSSIGSNCVLKTRCFCGAGSVVMPKRTVGRESVVAAGAVVTRDIPDAARVFGVPARVEA